MSIDVHKIAAVLAGGLAVLGQTLCQDKGWDFGWTWALLISIISTLVCTPYVLFAILRLKSSPANILERNPSMLLALLWTLGAVPTTIIGPFTLTGNGYFGSLAASYLSWQMVFASSSSLKDRLYMNGAEFATVLVASVGTFLQTSWSCSAVDEWCNGNAAWVLICSLVSSAVCFGLLLPSIGQKMQSHAKAISLFFLVWWAAGAVVTTFEKPFETSFANGYFGCWAAILASALLVDSKWGLSLAESPLSYASEFAGGTPKEILALLVSSLVCLVAAAIDCGQESCGGFVLWAIFCSTGSAACCTFAAVRVIRGDLFIDDSIMEKVSAALLLWWVLGVGCMTFGGPFWRLGNGYFAAWASFTAVSVLAAKHIGVIKRAREDLEKSAKEVGILLIASTVLVLQALWDITRDVLGNAGRNWPIACGSVSLVFCIVIRLQFEKLQGHLKWIVLGLFIWWSVGLGTMTFSGAYVRTGNGYFSCWAAWLGCGSLLLKHFPQLAELAGYVDLGENPMPAPAATLESKQWEPSPAKAGMGAEDTTLEPPPTFIGMGHSEIPAAGTSAVVLEDTTPVFNIETDESPAVDGTGVSGDNQDDVDQYLQQGEVDQYLQDREQPVDI